MSDEIEVKKMFPNAHAMRLDNGDTAIHSGTSFWLSLSRGWTAALFNIRAGELCANEKPATARANTLHIYISAARRWERHRCGSVEIREYLRAVWRRAGCATAVEL